MKAKRKIIITALALLSLISSCTVLSFYPLYTNDVLIKDDRIVGKWFTLEGASFMGAIKDTLVWEIKFDDEKWEKKPNAQYDRGSHQVDNKYAYSLFLYYSSTPEKKAEFQLHLVELDGNTYIDFFPEEWEIANSIMAFHLMGVHTFAKVNITEGSVKVNWFDEDWFEEKLNDNKIRIKHEKNSANILLTAQPKELQKFVIKYADDEKAFDEDAVFELKPLK